MKILFLAAEVAPFVRVGGLSQVIYFLPRALNNLGHDVRIFMPKYASIDNKQIKRKKKWKLKKEIENLAVPIENFQTKSTAKTPQESLLCNIKFYPKTRATIHTYFLENREYYELRANLYGYKDDHIRFALLSKGCLEWLLFMEDFIAKKDKRGWFPDVIHCNDWHTGYFIELARQSKRYSGLLAKIPIVFTVHNFLYQGNYDFRYGNHKEHDTGLTPLASLDSPKLQMQNALLRGILYADAVNTVSTTYAVEALTPQFGAGLEKELQGIRGKLAGILNGLDTKEFNPDTDPLIHKKYSISTFPVARRKNKIDLQRLFLLEENVNNPLFAISGRLVQQKGWDILLKMLPHLFAARKDVQLIVLGSGDEQYRDQITKLAKLYPKQIGLHLRSDFRLPRKLFSGVDIMLIPSTFEPGGIVALEALRYGAVPLVRRTGGLNDIVVDFDPINKTGNGFSFEGNDPWELFATIIEALTIYKQPHYWRKLIHNGMSYDFSWKYSAALYEDLYKNVLEVRKRVISIIPHPAYDEPIPVV
ncbi:MAG TPA: glycogen/starch synthase [Candidatus Sulfotelmatobacter sp.]|jgi:starch synthase|nr:glycogen/starch synthase [Candidatus Sulfotelmatobacter sp.]